jgi:arylsulfatase A-like enzyme
MGRLVSIVASVVAAFLASGCGEVASNDGVPFLLALHPEALASLAVPPDSRGGVQPPDEIPVRGPMILRRITEGIATWEAPMPIRSRALFFQNQPEGMDVRYRGQVINFAFEVDSGRSWSLSQDYLRIRIPSARPLLASDLEVLYPKATERERALNRRWSGLPDDPSFVLRSLQQDDTSRYGAFLPAPSKATWKLTIPHGQARFAADVGLLEPETTDLPPSDGATFVLTLEVGSDGPKELLRQRFSHPGRFDEVHADLSRWSGQDVALSLSSEPGSDATSDYLFAGEPTVYVPDPHPPRIVLVFVDTLRRDHMGIYGKAESPTPRLDAWAATGTIFADARVGAPWTLPSARSLLVGAQPERFEKRPVLPAILGRKGWTTGAFVGNIYLSSNFDMDRYWGTYGCVNWPRADYQIDKLEQWLSSRRDRPALAMLHLMDIHLPYREPLPYRLRFADKTKTDLPFAFARAQVVALSRGTDSKAVRSYIVSRYDASLHWIDDEVSDFLARFDANDTVALFSDHGEEFWDHEGFEHGHTLYDELLRVPLVIRSPGLVSGRVEEPVWLPDLAPTLLELRGDVDDAKEMEARSLVTLAGGNPDERKLFHNRRIAFGRVLYGREQWGVLFHREKYFTGSGTEYLYDLERDPGERRNIARTELSELESWHRKLSEGLGYPVYVAYRITADRGSVAQPLEVDLHVPGGVETAWIGNDPARPPDTVVTVEGETVHVTWLAGLRGTREVFVVPTEGIRESVPGLVLSGTLGTAHKEESFRRPNVPQPDGSARRLLTMAISGNSVVVQYAVAPEPPEGANNVSGFEPESLSALKALGYMDQSGEGEEGD